jgi:SAM-dependent methyltransferase
MQVIEIEQTFQPVVDYDFLKRQKGPSRKNIRKFVRDCALKNRLECPIVDVACGYRNNYPEIVQFYNETKPPLFIAFDWTLDFDHEIKGIPPNLIADAHQIPLSTNQVGTVVATEVLEHVEDDNIVLSEISRILKHGGLFLLTFPGIDVPLHEKLPHQKDYRRYTPPEVEYLLTENHFTNIEIEDKYFEGRQINILALSRKT